MAAEDENVRLAINVASCVPDEFRGGMIGACVMVLAHDTGVTPNQVLDAIKEGVAFPTDEEWLAERDSVGRLIRNARATYTVAGIYLERKRPQG